MWPPRSSSTAGSISVWAWLCREMANRERNKKILLELVKQSDNSRCADCGEPGKQIYKRWYVCYRNKVRRGSEFDMRVLLRGLEIFRFWFIFMQFNRFVNVICEAWKDCCSAWTRAPWSMSITTKAWWWADIEGLKRVSCFWTWKLNT